MKIAYIMPRMDEAERRRREKTANDIADLSTVKVLAMSEGPRTIESTVEEELFVQGLLRELYEIEGKYDAVIIGCFGDPGLRAAREFSNMVIVGPAETTFHTACLVADRFSVITPLKRLIPSTRSQVCAYGLSAKLASVRSLEVTIEEIVENQEKITTKIETAAEEAVRKDGAEALVLGCMSLGFILADELVEVDAPILNPAKISIKMAEVMTSLKLRGSRRTYPKPDLEKIRHIFQE